LVVVVQVQHIQMAGEVAGTACSVRLLHLVEVGDIMQVLLVVVVLEAEVVGKLLAVQVQQIKAMLGLWVKMMGTTIQAGAGAVQAQSVQAVHQIQ